MRFDYRLDGAGWATALIGFGEREVILITSYLHDSLRDVASAARAVVEGTAGEARCLFMDEPGEHEVTLRRDGDEVVVEVRWFDDWKSWGMYSGEGKLVLSGRVEVGALRAQIAGALSRVLAEHGLAGYKEKWVEHEFPTAEYNALRRLGGEEEITVEPPRPRTTSKKKSSAKPKAKAKGKA